LKTAQKTEKYTRKNNKNKKCFELETHFCKNFLVILPIKIILNFISLVGWVKEIDSFISQKKAKAMEAMAQMDFSVISRKYCVYKFRNGIK